MADSYTFNLNLRKPEVGAAKDNWGNAPLGINGDMDMIDLALARDGNGTTVGWHIGDYVETGTGLNKKSIGNAKDGWLLATADRFELYDVTDPTKIAHILLTGLATGATNNYFLPPLADVLVGIDNVQNLANKTCPDPAGGVIDNTQSVASAHWVQAVISAVLAAIPAPYVPDTGDIMASAAAAKAGWVKLAGGTIGAATSGATVLAGPTAEALFSLFWSINGATWPINGGRGLTNAHDDFVALKTITLPDARDMALVGIGGANVNIATLFATKGEATHLLITAEMPSHTHAINPGGGQLGFNSFNGVTGSGLALNAGGVLSLAPTGGDTAHNNVQPSMGVVYWIRL